MSDCKDREAWRVGDERVSIILCLYILLFCKTKPGPNLNTWITLSLSLCSNKFVRVQFLKNDCQFSFLGTQGIKEPSFFFLTSKLTYKVIPFIDHGKRGRVASWALGNGVGPLNRHEKVRLISEKGTRGYMHGFVLKWRGYVKKWKDSLAYK